MRRLLPLMLPVLLAGCGTHGAPTAIAPVAASIAATATLSRPFIDDPGQANNGACQSVVPAPKPPFSVTARAADTLTITCVQITPIHNFAGSGTGALVKGTLGAREVTLRFARLNHDDGSQSSDAAIDGQRRPVAEVEALIKAAPVSAQFSERMRAMLLGLLK